MTENFTMDAPDNLCQTETYNLNEEKNGDSGLEQMKENCSDSYLCKQVRMDTSFEKEHLFSWDVKSNAKEAYNLHQTQDYNVSITCGAEVQLISRRNISYVFPHNSSDGAISMIDF